jgi:hypothetical protein
MKAIACSLRDLSNQLTYLLSYSFGLARDPPNNAVALIKVIVVSCKHDSRYEAAIFAPSMSPFSASVAAATAWEYQYPGFKAIAIDLRG